MKKTRKRKQKLLAIVLTVILALYVSLHLLPGTRYVDIGAFKTRDAAIVASIKQLSRDLYLYPFKDTFRVYWESEDSRGMRLKSTLYMRNQKTIGWEGDPGSGFSESWSNVDVSAIQKIARENGTFDGFKQYNTQE